MTNLERCTTIKELSGVLFDSNYFGYDASADAVQSRWENVAKRYTVAELLENDGRLIDAFLAEVSA